MALAATVNLEHGEIASINWTIAADLTNKKVVWTVAATAQGTRLLRKASDTGGVTISQSTPTGIGSVTILEADFTSIPHVDGNIVDGIPATRYYYSLWYEDSSGGSNPVHTAFGFLIVKGTVPRAANP